MLRQAARAPLPSPVPLANGWDPGGKVSCVMDVSHSRRVTVMHIVTVPTSVYVKVLLVLIAYHLITSGLFIKTVLILYFVLYNSIYPQCQALEQTPLTTALTCPAE